MIRVVLLAATLGVAFVPAQAQSTQPQPPARPAAKPPSIVMPQAPARAAAQKTLGGKAASGKLLTREELRSCMKRLDETNAAGKDLEQRRATLDKERDELGKSAEALKAERADVESKLAAVRDWQTRARAHGTEVEAFNQRSKTAEQAPRGEREAMIKALEAERERLGQAQAPLAADEARLVPAYQNAVKAYNERALARDAVVADWNERNKAVNEAALRHEEQRAAWVSECANRPYKEDDEIAIKQGR
jgi:chromosome segregation ATPase